MNQAIQRSGLPMLFLVAIVLAAAIGLVLLFATPLPDFLLRATTDRSERDAGREPPQQSTPTGTTSREEVADAQPEPGPPPQPEPQPAPRHEPAPAQAHRVTSGDTLFDLSEQYWADAYLWPMLLVANAENVKDPDFLRQGLVLRIPARPDVEGGPEARATNDTDAVVDAHFEAYLRYRALGDASLARGRAEGSLWLVQRGLMRVNKAHWVLYSGLRYDENLLERAAPVVSDEDIRIVLAYIARFGPRPGMSGWPHIDN